MPSRRGAPTGTLRGLRHGAAPEERRRTLSREAIVEAALSVVDREGVDAVTMRRVADELDTGPASLYAHVSDKDELLAAVYDRVAGELEVAPPADPRRWQDGLREFLRAWRRVLLAHRDIAKVGLGTVPTGPNVLRHTERMVALMEGAGVPPAVIGLAGDLVAQFVATSVYEESLFRQRLAEPGALENFHAELEQFFGSLDPEQFPALRRLAKDLAGDPGEAEDARFEFGLDVLLRGLTARIAEHSTRHR